MTIAMVTGAFAYYLRQIMKKDLGAMEPSPVAPEKKREPENVSSLLQVDHLEVEIGYSLIPLVDEAQGGDLLERITGIRRQMAGDLGLVVPPIRIRDNMQLQPAEYVIKIKGVDVSRWKIIRTPVGHVHWSGHAEDPGDRDQGADLQFGLLLDYR
jgi:flagellar biosynthesis protein FlhA